MGFIDKLKDLFTDEEEVIEDKEIEEDNRDEHKLPTFMREKIEKEEKQRRLEKEKKEHEEELIANQKFEEQRKTLEVPTLKLRNDLIEDKREKPNKSELRDQNLVTESKKKFRFPVNLEDKDYMPTSNQNVIKREIEKPKPVKEIYANKKEKKVEPPRFKVTPIISPIYGILDKNYSKDDLRDKGDPLPKKRVVTPTSTSTVIDFESVRKKAFGNLTDDIKDNMLCENCELYNHFKEVNKNKSLEEDELLYDISSDNITIAEADENYHDFGVSYDCSIKPIEKTQEIKIINHNDEEIEAEKIEVKETVKYDPINTDDDYLEEKEDNLELTDDLFNLIDSMYADKEDE